jgi:hypothetical protein
VGQSGPLWSIQVLLLLLVLQIRAPHCCGQRQLKTTPH